MIIHTVELTIPNARSEQFYDFMINPSDERYREWWQGEHLQFHIVKTSKRKSSTHDGDNHLGDVVFMDEHIGKDHRLIFYAVVVTADRPNKITWQMKKAGLRLPAFVTLELYNSSNGIKLRHELRIGYKGLCKILDPFIRMYFSKSFRKALEEHCKIEWYKLSDYLN
jgi:hypothetical protein